MLMSMAGKYFKFAKIYWIYIAYTWNITEKLIQNMEFS